MFQLDLTMNYQLCLEVMLMEISDKTISYSPYKKKEADELETSYRNKKVRG